MDMNMINNKFTSQAIHVGTQDLTVYCKPKNFLVLLIFVIFVFGKICKKQYLLNLINCYVCNYIAKFVKTLKLLESNIQNFQNS